MELQIYSPSEDGFLKEITFNHEEIKQELTLRLQKYEGLTYTDEEIKAAKSDRANLNKFKEALENKRKEIKKLCLAPYEAFEAKMKEILALVDKPILAIDSQIKAFEDKQKEEKREKIKAIYNESIGDLSNILPLARLWDEKWLNATYKLTDISKEVIDAVNKTKTDLSVIEGLGSEFDLQVKDSYLQTLDLTRALQEKTRLEEQKAKLEEYKRQQEAKKQDDEERHRIFVAPNDEIQRQEPSIESVLEYTQEIEPELEMIEFRAWVTPEQKKLLGKFLIDNKIKCGKVR